MQHCIASSNIGCQFILPVLIINVKTLRLWEKRAIISHQRPEITLQCIAFMTVCARACERENERAKQDGKGWKKESMKKK